jgi:hypothetical protein
MCLKELVTSDDAIEAVNRCVSLYEVIISDISTTSPDTRASDLLTATSQAKYPFSVIGSV